MWKGLGDMGNYQENRLSGAKRFKYRVSGKRKKILLTGYSGAGKTTILTVLDKRRDVEPKEVPEITDHDTYFIEFKTKGGKGVFIKSDDVSGDATIYEKEAIAKLLKKHDYILYLLDTYSFMNEMKPHEKLKCKAWLKHIFEIAKEDKKPFMLVLSHADLVPDPNEKDGKRSLPITEERKRELRKLFLGDAGLLSDTGINCKVEVANVLKYDAVKEIINELLELKHE